MVNECYKTPTEKSNIRLADCHVHVGFMSNAAEVAADAQADGLLCFANTVTPQEYLALRDEPWTQFPNVRLGVGLHPWWVARGATVELADTGLSRADYATSVDVHLAAQLATKVPWVGEVGLDFSPKHTDPSTHEAQVTALREVLNGIVSGGANPTPVVSLHAVASADTVLDLLEQTSAAESCHCVFHWFSGSTPALWRAIRLGCWFSVNEMQARTRRAKEQLKLVPSDHLLLETDLPPHRGEPFLATAIEESLARTFELLATIRGTDPDEVRELTTRNAQALLL